MNEIIREIKICLFRADQPVVSCKPYSGIMGGIILRYTILEAPDWHLKIIMNLI